MISRSFGMRTTTTSPMMRSKGFGLYSAGRFVWPAANKRFCQAFYRKFGAMHKMRLRYVNFLYKSASISLNGEFSAIQRRKAEKCAGLPISLNGGFSEVQCKGGSLYTSANKCSPLAPVKPGYFTPKELRKGAGSCGCAKELARSCACKGFLLYIGAAQPHILLRKFQRTNVLLHRLVGKSASRPSEHMFDFFARKNPGASEC